ncbi:hypothetical protein ACVU7I_17185, partial [Patulibacter sp. S7RM1-6]
MTADDGPRRSPDRVLVAALVGVLVVGLALVLLTRGGDDEPVADVAPDAGAVVREDATIVRALRAVRDAQELDGAVTPA